MARVFAENVFPHFGGENVKFEGHFVMFERHCVCRAGRPAAFSRPAQCHAAGQAARRLIGRLSRDP